MWEAIQRNLRKSDYYRQLAHDYWTYGNDHMSAYADLKSAYYYNRALSLLGKDWGIAC